VLLRNGVAQALRRAGYLASFVCRPPFANIMSSGWHLHQSLVDEAGGNLFMRQVPAPCAAPADAHDVLSGLGGRWLAGLLAHAPGGSAFATPTINGYGRYGVNALAPQAVLWGRDNRGAMLRVLGGPGDAATRIENRCGEPLANPYLYIAAQIHAGLDGLARALRPPPATESPYAGQDRLLPASLADALAALQRDESLCAGFGQAFIDHYLQIKQHELQRHAAAADHDEWQRREYFSRF
jgi:glutamine synthetase